MALPARDPEDSRPRRAESGSDYPRRGMRRRRGAGGTQ